MTDSEIIIDWGGTSDRGMRRNLNEDTYVCDPDRMIFLVADGMGGENYGEVASRLAADFFVELITPFLLDDDVTIPFEISEDGDHFSGAMHHAVQGANEAVYAYASEHPSHKGMGSTLTATVIMGDALHIGHIGDSRLYRIQSDKIQQITKDHTKVQEMVEKNLLTPDEARKHPQKNIITRCVGRKKRLQADVFQVDYSDDDIYLICSDGLNDMVEDESILQIVQASQTLDAAAARLVETANQNGGRDNITVVLFRVNSSPEEPTTIGYAGQEDAA